MKNIVFLLIGILTFISCSEKEPIKKGPPNIIYILADDLGYGDLSCYGQELFSTPNIDALAANGMRFTQHYSGSTVCAPSRAVLMTGLHTGHVSIRGNKEIRPEGQAALDPGEETIAEMLKGVGYTTGAFGKWGLGFPGSEGEPTKAGFDSFFGYNCQRLAHHYFPRHLWQNEEKVELPENEGKSKGTYAPQLIQERTLSFIDQNKDKPFFLYVPHVIPHAELVAPDSLMEKYRGKFLPEKEYVGTDDGEKYRNGPYESQKESHAAFVAMVDLLDQHVGQIVAKVKEHGLLDNTIIIFTSDNGPHHEGGADPQYFNSSGPFLGIKRDLKDGGIRVPMIASWPGHIAPGITTDHLSSFQDVKATIAEITSINEREVDDGISFLPTLKQEEGQAQHEYLYWEFGEGGEKVGVRYGKWKAIKANIKNTENPKFTLYDLEASPQEKDDIAEDNPEIIAKIKQIVNEAHIRNDNFLLTMDQ